MDCLLLLSPLSAVDTEKLKQVLEKSSFKLQERLPTGMLSKQTQAEMLIEVRGRLNSVLSHLEPF